MVLGISTVELEDILWDAQDGEFAVLVRTDRQGELVAAKHAVFDAVGPEGDQTWVRDLTVFHDGVQVEYGGSLGVEEAEASLLRAAEVIRSIDPDATFTLVKDESPRRLRIADSGPAISALIIPTQVDDAFVEKCVDWTGARKGITWYGPGASYYHRRSPLDFAARDIVRREGGRLVVEPVDRSTTRELVKRTHSGWGLSVAIVDEDRTMALVAELVDLLRTLGPRCGYAALYRTPIFGSVLAEYAFQARHAHDGWNRPRAEGAQHLTHVSEVFGVQLLTDRHRLPATLPTGWRVEQLDENRRLLLAEDLPPWFEKPKSAEHLERMFDQSREQFAELLIKDHA